MSNDLITFNFVAQSVRVLMIDGEPWFVAADVLEVLTLDRKALERLDSDEKGVSSIPVSYTHLDVYKRQDLQRIFCAFTTHPLCISFPKKRWSRSGRIPRLW